MLLSRVCVTLLPMSASVALFPEDLLQMQLPHCIVNCIVGTTLLKTGINCFRFAIPAEAVLGQNLATEQLFWQILANWKCNFWKNVIIERFWDSLGLEFRNLRCNPRIPKMLKMSKNVSLA